MKTCTKCGVAKPASDYYQAKKTGTLRAQCKMCCNERTRTNYAANPKAHLELTYAWRRRNPERVKAQWAASRVKRRTEIHSEWLKYQQGVCALCLRPQDDPMQMEIDHCHRTGAVRGLLCRPCNQMLGKGQEDPVILRRGAEYLERFPADMSLPKAFPKSDWWKARPPA